MSERVEHPYKCINAGCVNGKGSTFYAAPPTWFASKGYSTPKNCPDCRKWIKQQVRSDFRCTTCKIPVRISAGRKIMHHKKEGPYVLEKQCRGCLEGKNVTKKVVRRPRKTLPELDKGKPVSALSTVSYDETSSKDKVHYGKHIVGHPLSEVGQPRGNGVVSPTSLVRPNASQNEFFNAGQGIAVQTSAHTYQYKSKANGNILKVTVLNDAHLEVTVFALMRDGRYKLITSYDNFSIQKAIKLIADEEWI